MERGSGALSAAQEVFGTYGIRVASIASLDDIVKYLRGRPELTHDLQAVEAYRLQYGAA